MFGAQIEDRIRQKNKSTVQVTAAAPAPAPAVTPAVRTSQVTIAAPEVPIAVSTPAKRAEDSSNQPFRLLETPYEQTQRVSSSPVLGTLESNSPLFHVYDKQSSPILGSLGQDDEEDDQV